MTMGGDTVVLPGDEIGVIEEYIAGEYVDETRDGRLIAQVLGRIIRDNVNHIISVKPLKRARLPRQNDVVYGVIVALPNDRVAVTKILAIYANGGLEPVKGELTGLIPISQIANMRLNGVSEMLGIGDIVRAKVISRGPPFVLTVRDSQLGVVFSRCPMCNQPLKWKGVDSLKCPSCNLIVKKKVCLVEYWG